MSFMCKISFTGALMLLALAAVAVRAQEWTQWRGPARDGSVSGKNVPTVLLTPQHVVFLTNNADLIVAKRGTPAFALERRYDDVAQAATWAMPVLLGSNILVR